MLLERKVLGVESGSAFLECEPRSLQAHVEWTFHRAGEAAHTQVCLANSCSTLPNQPHLREAMPCRRRPLACISYLCEVQFREALFSQILLS